MPDAKSWTFSGSAGRRGQLARWWPVVWWSTSPGDLLVSTVPKLRNLLNHFCTNLLPGVSFSCRCFKLKFDRNRRLVSCNDVAKMHVSTQNIFSLIFHIVLHQVHWHLFCHILNYLCAKNHKFCTCRLSARDDNLGVLLSGPPCILRSIFFASIIFHRTQQPSNQSLWSSISKQVLSFPISLRHENPQLVSNINMFSGSSPWPWAEPRLKIHNI